jgi:hypothetical protein
MMSRLPVEWKINRNRPTPTEPLRATLAEIEVYSEERSGGEPEVEVEA